ncbi:hypothetical protein ASG92_22190 [Arthrobacter sp. Soil736]|nr:hypothetical protein ASG92_22190 [Arthrobacter sp. Soil736]
MVRERAEARPVDLLKKPTALIYDNPDLVLGAALFDDGGVGFCDDGPGTKTPRGLFPAGRSSSA